MRELLRVVPNSETSAKLEAQASQAQLSSAHFCVPMLRSGDGRRRDPPAQGVDLRSTVTIWLSMNTHATRCANRLSAPGLPEPKGHRAALQFAITATPAPCGSPPPHGFLPRGLSAACPAGGVRISTGTRRGRHRTILNRRRCTGWRIPMTGIRRIADAGSPVLYRWQVVP